MSLLSQITSLFAQKKCYVCHWLWHFFCLDCQDRIYLYEPYCFVCKKKNENFSIHASCQKSILWISQIIVLGKYNNSPLRSLLKKWKFYRKKSVYNTIINLYHKRLSSFVSHVNNPIIVPLPMHFLRRMKRWYNHAEIITQELSSMTQIPYKNILQKKKYSPQQSKLSLKERQKNLFWSFKINKKYKDIEKNSTIYLIDDIISSGSTLKEAAKTLQQEWFHDIRAIILASD